MNSADEGYSEAPLTSIPSDHKSLARSRGRSPPNIDFLLTNISHLSVAQRTELTLALLDDLPTSIVADIVMRLNPRLYIDFVMYMPPEICLKILGYLDPQSLIDLAKACRAWHNLASDSKLWQLLYYDEGWKTNRAEIELWEKKVNASALSGSSLSGPLHRLRSSEDGHVHKKRAITSPTASTEDGTTADDVCMADAAGACEGPEETGTSIFGRSSTRTCVTPGFGALNMNGYMDPKGKGKGKEVASPTSHPRETSEINPESWPEIIPAETNLPKSTLWNWHSNENRYKLNWKYMYSKRHRLERNWESGKFVNFQFPRPDHMEEGHKECIYSLQFNQEYLVSGSRDRTIRIWDMNTRRLVRRPMTGHGGSVLCLQFDSSPEEDIIVSGSSDSDVIVWRFSTGEMIQRLSCAHAESVLNVRFDKRILVTCSKDKTIKIFNRRAMHPGEVGYGEPGVVYPAGTQVKQYGTMYDGLDNMPIKPPFSIIGSLSGHSAAVNAVQICGNEVVSASGDRTLKIWDWPSQSVKRTFIGHTKGIACVQYDGKRIVSGSNDNEVKVFDSQTGLEVAGLRAHTDLVRTIQAGFADLPYSDHEDLQEAMRVTKEYHEAVAAGTLPEPRRGMPGNAGSSRPEHQTSFGAKLPPGGGGGKYARIVSGSYDETIIIWKRDSEGVWKKHHHLRQEEGAVAAGRREGRTARTAGTDAVFPTQNADSTLARLRAQRQPDAALDSAASGQLDVPGAIPSTSRSRRGARAQLAIARAQAAQAAQVAQAAQASSSSAASSTAAASTAAASTAASSSVATSATSTHDLPTDKWAIIPARNSSQTSTLAQSSARSLAQMIDVTVPQGVYTLQQAISNFPAILALQTELHAAIDREPNTFLRGQLRQVVSTALVRMQLAQARAHRESLQNMRVQNSAVVAARAASGAGPSGSGSRPPAATSNSAPSVLASGVTGSGPGGGGGGPPPMQDDASGASASGPHLRPVPSGNRNVSAVNGGTPAGPPPAPTTAPAQPAPGGAARHHPNNPNGGEERTPVRVFKLQFDVRRIICCSQTSVIVGWDFCNGDPELEEGSRFWASVE